MKSCLKPLTIGLVFCFLADASILRAQTDAREQTVPARPGPLNGDDVLPVYTIAGQPCKLRISNQVLTSSGSLLVVERWFRHEDAN